MRRGYLAAALFLLCVAWSPWASTLAAQRFTAHMAVHMTVVAIAAPLLAIGLRGTAIVRFGAGRVAPIPASLIELIVVWGWHVPALHHAARSDPAIFAAEQASFLLSGLLLWGSVLHASWAGIIALLITFAHMTLLGAILALAPRPLYPHSHSLTGMSALEDQHLGGAIMLVVGGISYLAGGLWLAAALLQNHDPSAAFRGRQRGPADPQPPEASGASASPV